MREVNNTCPVCNTKTLDQYVVTDVCWEEAGFTFYQNAHLHCLVGELHRRLVLTDFPDHPVNCDIQQVLEQDVIRLPQDVDGQKARRIMITQECWRDRLA